MTHESDASWNEISDVMRQAVGERIYGLWLAPLRCHGRDGDTLLLSGPREVVSWASTRLDRVLQTSAAAVLGPGAGVRLSLATSPAADSGMQTHLAARRRATPTAPLLNPKYTFEQFVIGASNRFAHAAALSVAELPAGAYTPLVICGPPGLGKTHLLHSIGNYVRRYGDGLEIRFTTGESFISDFVASAASRSLDDFKRRHRETDVLLIDDVDAIQHKARTEDELFHTFNALHDAGRQLVFTTELRPSELTGLAARLRQRLDSGLVTHIERPDFATRLAILRSRAAHDGLIVEDDRFLPTIAHAVDDCVRRLEGALIRAVALASLTGRGLTGDVASDVVNSGPSGTSPPAPVSVEAIQIAVCERFAVSHSDLLSRSRLANIAWPRQVAMYVVHELTAESLPAIGRAFGNRDHTTVLHACQRVAQRICSDATAYADVTELTASLSQPAS